MLPKLGSNYFSKLKGNNSEYVFLSIIFSLICITFWCFWEYYNLGTDYGKYYLESKYISEDYKLYDQIFTHKGPFYFYFLHVIGKLFGWGILNSIYSLIISLLLFFIPIFFLILKTVQNNKLKILLILMSTSLLIGQDSNSSIAFFQEGLLLISFSFLCKLEKSLLSFVFAQIFFWLAFFTRVDVIIFLPLILTSSLIFTLKQQFTLNKFFSFFTIFTIPILLFIFFSNYFGFDWNQYFIHNFTFNNWYRNHDINDSLVYKIQKLFYRPLALALGSQTFILPFILYFLKKDINNLIWKNSKMFFENYKKYFLWIFIILGIFGFLLTNSDKNYFALIFLGPGLFLIIKKFSYNSGQTKLAFLPILFFCLAINSSLLIKNVKRVYYRQSDLLANQRTIDYVKENKLSEIELIGGNGYSYLLSGAAPNRAVNDWWFYLPDSPFTTKGLLKQHENLLNRPSGYIFWINNQLLEKNKKNKFLSEIISRSVKIEDQNGYSMYKIK